LDLSESIDDELLVRYQGGDFAAFDAFYVRNHELIFRFLMFRLRNRSDAEEAFQETFLRIHRSIGSYKKGNRALPWVFTVAKNVAIDSFKRRKNTVSIDEGDAVIDPRTLDALQLRQELELLLVKLTKQDQELLNRRLIDDEDFESLAFAMKTNPVNLRQRFSRLMRRLRTQTSR
jgi:RNA polymerase sigma-70 factor (ECF subfamily)